MIETQKQVFEKIEFGAVLCSWLFYVSFFSRFTEE